MSQKIENGNKINLIKQSNKFYKVVNNHKLY